MRRTAWLGMTLAALLWGGWARADEPKVQYTAAITANEAEVRSGAGDSNQLYPTNRLRKGDRVDVVREREGGWLEIKPPPGSFSWINSRFVRRTANTSSYVVIAHPDTRVPLLLGSSIRSDKPSVEGAKVVRGTLLRAIGPMRPAEDGYWLPVVPPASEVRYLRAEAVAKKPAEVTASAAPPAQGGVAEPPGGAPPDPAGPGGVTPPDPSRPPETAPPAAPAGPNPLLQRAQQAEQAGQYAEAIRLYQQLGAETAASNHGLSVQAYNRAQHLSDALAGRPARPVVIDSGKAPATAPTTPPAGMESSGPGRLKRLGQMLDYSPLYVLENSRGIPFLYATAQPGYSLDVYVNRNVELIGPKQYRSDLRANHMVVRQVKPLQ